MSRKLVSVLTSDLDLLALLEPLSAEGVGLILAKELREAAASAPVILFDADSHAPWQDGVAQLLELNPEAIVIVASRLADEYMWLEVLSIGAYDLLPKPSRSREVRGVVLGGIDRATRVPRAA